MRKKLLFGILVIFILTTFNSFAGKKFLGTGEWKIKNLQNNGETITTKYTVLFLDIEIGSTFFNVYGAVMDESHNDGMSVDGSGYIVDFPKENKPSILKLEVRAGTYLYNIRLNNTFNGLIDIFDFNGNKIAEGDIEFVRAY